MFCPLIKDECRNEQCVMWGDEECLIIPVLKYFGNSEEESPDDQTEIEEEVPEEIKSATPIELADELMTFYKAHDLEGNTLYLDPLVLTPFWESKGVDKFSAPLEIKAKIIKTEELFDKRLQSELDEAELKVLEKEEAELPALADSCCSLGKRKGAQKSSGSKYRLIPTEKDQNYATDGEHAAFNGE